MFTLSAEACQILGSVPDLINKTFPIPGRFRNSLPADVAELSRQLTGGRRDRSLSYLSRPNFLSAYLRYFLPWNLYRLCRLLSSLDLCLPAGSTVIDLGSGPLTFVSALWISRPDLRGIPLEFHCIDRCAPALEAGKSFFANISANSNNLWKIHCIKKDIDFRKESSVMRKEAHSVCRNAALVCAANIFNEVYEDIPHNNIEDLRKMTANIARFIHSNTAANGSILTVEPGVPQSGRFINLLRSSFIELNRLPLSPCPHTTTCPMPGGKKRWCHFAFNTDSAPKELYRLSAAAKLPKDRLVLSYLYAGQRKKEPGIDSNEAVRVISDTFLLPNNRFGRYCCSAKGLVLLAGVKKQIEEIVSGSLVTPVFTENLRDEKSGAMIAEVL